MRRRDEGRDVPSLETTMEKTIPRYEIWQVWLSRLRYRSSSTSFSVIVAVVIHRRGSRTNEERLGGQGASSGLFVFQLVGRPGQTTVLPTECHKIETHLLCPRRLKEHTRALFSCQNMRHQTVTGELSEAFHSVEARRKLDARPDDGAEMGLGSFQSFSTRPGACSSVLTNRTIGKQRRRVGDRDQEPFFKEAIFLMKMEPRTRSSMTGPHHGCSRPRKNLGCC